MARKTPTNLIARITRDIREAQVFAPALPGQPADVGLFMLPSGATLNGYYRRSLLARLDARASWCADCGDRHPELHQDICAECENALRRIEDRRRDDHDLAYDSARDEGLLR